MGIIKSQSEEACGLCSISDHGTTNYTLKKEIETEISGDDLIDYLRKRYPFKIIESGQSYNVYRTNINGKKIKYVRCQQLLCSTTPRSNIWPDE